ncbi:MAG: hypothetical protein GY953_06590, partial [bacterium]|nr:hypothetical protein [bacterium]
MLHSAKMLSRYSVRATDGKIGQAVDAYIDDLSQQICYLVVEPKGFLSGGNLLVPSARLKTPDTASKSLPVEMTKEEAKQCQPASEELPVSWRKEELITAKYGPLEERGGAPVAAVHGSISREAIELVEANTAAALGEQARFRSLREMLGYQIEAVDGPLGIAEDFLIEDALWVVRYIVVDTQSWKPGRQVLAPPLWVEQVSWAEHRIHLRVSRHKLKTSQRAA